MNSNTQNAKIEAITEKTLVIGIDVGSETHNARAFTWRGIELTKRPSNSAMMKKDLQLSRSGLLIWPKRTIKTFISLEWSQPVTTGSILVPLSRQTA